MVDANGDRAGQVTWAASYNAWGDIKEEYNPLNLQQPIRFQGQQVDIETGLHYNRYRHYDPAGSQYVTQDPIGLRGGTNSIQYVGNNPCNWIDPLGLDRWGDDPAQNVPKQCTYSQSTGNLTCTRNGIQVLNQDGYAGRGTGRNNPDQQNVRNTGPIPRGGYTMGEAHRHRTAGAATIRLEPDATNEMHGRDGFLIHGDNATNDASEGCIIVPRATRDQLRAGDRLEVIR